jgi:mannan endo-1,4-beta-mannosidase
MIARVLAFLLAVAACAAPAAMAETAPGFVTTAGSAFVQDGRPFRIAGVNNHYLAYASRDEVVRVLDDAVAMNANVVRTFVTPIIGSLDGRTPTIWKWRSPADASNLGVRGSWIAAWDPDAGRMIVNEGANGLAKMDFVLQEASRRNLKLIIAFADFWAYTGGAQQISAWYGGTDKHAFFATDARARADYKRLVRTILTRTNTLTGIAYRDDPTILGWNLLNEPDIRPNELFMDWVQEMAGYVKSLDPNHLVSTGHDSIRTNLMELALKDIDFGTWHGYPAYRNITSAGLEEVIRTSCRMAGEVGKPVILEEFGVASNDPSRSQAESYRDWLALIAATPDCAGWLVWRLVSRQDSGKLPFDHDRFDVHRDGGPTWTILRDAAASITGAASSPPGPKPRDEP